MFKDKIRESSWLFKLESNRSLSLLFSIYFVSLFLFYLKASNGLLVDDGIAGLVKFENQGYAGFLNSFGFTSLYYFHDFFVLLVYLVMGKSSFGWFTVMIGMHSVNAFLNFVVFRQFYSILEIRHASVIAFIGSVLFAFSPYQTENVVWAATLHYSIALFIFFISARLILNNLAYGHLQTKTILVTLILFVVALLTLEISLIFPFAYFCLAFAVVWNKKTSVTLTELISRFLLPLIGTILLYFIATRIFKGHWIPHYGETHLQNNTLQNYSTNIARYLLKLLGFTHFAEFKNREMLYALCEHWKKALFLELTVVIFLIFSLTILRKKRETKTFISLVALGFVFLLPVLHMYFMYLFNTENDRLIYFFSVALYQMVPFFLIQLSFILGVFISIVYAMIGLYFLNGQITKWHEAGIIHTNCINSFVWTETPKIYVLNAPTNYNGVYQFRNKERLPYALSFFKNYKHSERIEQVLSSTFSGWVDSTVVNIENDSTLHVSLDTNSGWFMNEFVGATDYTSENFRVQLLQENTASYRVVFHKKNPGDIFVYSSHSGFHQVTGF